MPITIIFTYNDLLPFSANIWYDKKDIKRGAEKTIGGKVIECSYRGEKRGNC
jgi:hypothetical protein